MDENQKLISHPNEFYPLGIIPMEGAAELSKKIDQHLTNWFHNLYPEYKEDPEVRDTTLLEVTCPRFTSGDGKAVLKQSVRGNDIFIITDMGNYACEYEMFGRKVPMSPDDHYQDLKRIIQAMAGKAYRISVIMPTLYGGRQHKRSSRESLDCAVALQELERIGVKNIITFDAHDPRVQNATPFMGFDNVMPTYQVLKALLGKYKDMNLDKDHLMIVSPDEGAMNRNIYYASVLGVDLGMFYKRRDYSTVVNGRNPIVAHEYMGNSVAGKDILVADDIIASGESMLGLAYELKEKGARRIFVTATYGLFTEGLDKFQKAIDDGAITGILTTNLTYQSPELLAKDWYTSVDCSKYIAYYILAMHENQSVSKLLDPHKKIDALLEQYKKEQGAN
ncbi:MAG: ribose-phosphate pyrophosphokinase [Clostridia bacterium]|nr:ribose-phosphate pyrophosphokinase [Clostridia bacterium]MBQ5820939.1 ribose-phosphate pyrophosphokinase [Clostridia bacterium]